MTFLWPRLPGHAATVILADIEDLDLKTIRADHSRTSHPQAAAAPVGGPLVPDRLVSELRDRLQQLADSHGFPTTLGKSSVATFDRPATRLLHDQMRIIPADAASEEVWNFVSLVVAPDVACWRFPDRARDRLIGRPRNVFRRLWWRAEVVGVELIDMPAGLGEDELVNIMERPNLAANPVVGRSLAAAVVALGELRTGSRMEIMRDAAKLLLRRMAVVCMDVLPDEELRAEADRCVAAALAGHGLSGAEGRSQPLSASSPAGATPARWAPDPTRRHELRYWNGREWSGNVADGGVRGWDLLR